MKKITLFLLICIACFGREYNFAPRVKNPEVEKPIVIVIPSYNNKMYYQKNLDSIFSQKYTNFRVIYTNDASSDGTGKLVKEYVEKSEFRGRFDYIENKKNQGALYNVYQMIHSCKDNEIIVTVDGDDHLITDRALERINQAYADDRVWVTYGQDTGRRVPSGHSRKMGMDELEKGTYRKGSWRWSQLRTCYAGLFKSIPEEKWKRDGRFYRAGGDVAFVLYILDLAREHVYFIPDVMYYYNTDNPICDFKIRLRKQIAARCYIWDLPPLNRFYHKDEFIFNDGEKER